MVRRRELLLQSLRQRGVLATELQAR